MLEIGAAQNGMTFVLRQGEMVELRLAENRTTGFTWQVKRDGGPACRITAERYAAPSGPPGSSGTHVWRIEGVRPGLCALSLALSRPWETGPPSATFAFSLDVARGG